MGLCVDGVGEIKMPLSEEQARALIAKSRQAPFGRGSETIVDTSIRNTWEIDASQFSFQDPEWPGFLDSLCETVAEDLGIESPIKPELYKMLIYEKGAMFKAHTDTEKIPGMFGTLVICLPSPHEGGDVVAKHLRETKTFKTSIHQQSTIYWYSDVHHQVLPVTSGYRWKWLDIGKRQVTKMNWLYHVLDHEYTEANLSFNALKNEDLARPRALTGISKEPGLPFEVDEDDDEDEDEDEDDGRKRGGGGDYHTIEDICDSSLTVTKLVDLQGRDVVDGLDFQEEDLLDEQFFQDREPDEEEYEGFTGNEGQKATHWYRTTALVLVPRDSLHTYFATCKNSSGVISYFTRLCQDSDLVEATFDTIQKFCTDAWSEKTNNLKDYSYYSSKPEPLSGNTYQDVFKTAISLGRFSFFEDAGDKHAGTLPIQFFPWLRQWLGDQDIDERFQLIEKGLNKSLKPYPYLSQKVEAVYELLGRDLEFADLKSQVPETLLNWAQSTFRGIVDSCSKGGADFIERDGSMMVVLAMCFDDPIAFIKRSIVPILDPTLNPVSFTLAFMAGLQDERYQSSLPTPDVNELHYTLAKSFIERASIHKAESKGAITAAAKRPCYGLSGLSGWNKTQPSSTPQVDAAIGPEAVLTFFDSILPHPDLVDSFINKLTSSITLVPQIEEFHHLWLPFLRSLINKLNSNRIPLSTPMYQSLYSTSLLHYLRSYVQRKGTMSTSLVRPTVSCSCMDCMLLNNFLASATQKVDRFPMGKNRRDHLQRRLEQNMIDCTHATERKGSPHTLVVTKTWKADAEKRDAWNKRRRKAVEEIGGFRKKDLKDLLGPKNAEAVWGVDMEVVFGIKLEERSQERVSLAPLRSDAVSNIGGPRRLPGFVDALGFARPPLAGTKRKTEGPDRDQIEVVDLTGDD
ncbi:hypothetical protein QBC43DRAFT_380518 [Cladorrhinum sp. PSN259]|nr:hypothetical protein QBC43DRAFT_380518 [Cladorrhinum sp. PSN259]